MSRPVQVESDVQRTGPGVPPPVGRRSFLRALALAVGGGLFTPPSAWSAPRRAETLRIGLVAPPAGSRPAVVESAVRGVTLGVEEAARTGELFGRGIELRTADAAEALVAAGGVAALVGGWDEAGCRGLGALADSAGILFLNVGCASDALRGGECRRGLFHVESSEAMRRDALAGRGSRGADATSAALWHPSLERFGAAQLNERFRARFAAEMDGPAWAGWMAVKALWEASLRARTSEPAGLRAHLASGTTRFDGHK
ncbi:MAG TPA: ABC transporter substrate-binding protein, partial [Longimicrobiaceae bacterium]|nr:ABC transporter substrate-binding protein [Longimicrobiaceae bacterium]